ncbi:hypothetical protein [Xenorhabdus miraniensis]|uniref:Uncharacterized protein n=1 Tax=Xenorhabdus miraniensis TaxID=351674 RepID=A0A2D0JPF5_9GAMM|nr:hypothetical protein [Xenorhabdus miraniensis]PHM48216.1 hypothetical protein Xmir_02554 [Xenorhabdus miraniensis]
MSKHLDSIGNYFEHLGPYDCFFNALTYFMEYNDINADKLHSFNFNISYHFPTHIFSGTVEPHIFFVFLKEFFYIEKRVYYLKDLNKIPLNEIFILESNAYFFKSEHDYYQKENHTKYVISKRIETNKFLIWDPYDNITVIKFISDFYVREKFNIHGFYLYRHVNKKNNSIVTPFLLEKNYIEEYSYVFNSANELISSMKSNKSNKLILKDMYIFRKFYGCIRGISMVRERHFRSEIIKYNGNEILTGWNIVQKNIIKFGLQFKNSDSELIYALESIFDKEIKYLDSYKFIV